MKTILLMFVALSTAMFAQSSFVPMTYQVALNGDVVLMTDQSIVSLIVEVNGTKTKTVYRHDFYTKPIEFDPENSLTIPMDKASMDPDAAWKVNFIWCQFTDGTQWGDLVRGKAENLAVRAKAMALYQALAQADDTAFRSLIQSHLGAKDDLRITADMLQSTMWSGGITVARGMVASRLERAAERGF
jgi:hypothetical protein